MDLVLTPERMKEWGLHKRSDTDVLIYSMGSIDEGHGAALQRDNDDLVAKRTAVLAAERLGIQYSAHIPYGSDRAGEIAKDWCPAWIEPGEATKKVIGFIRENIRTWPKKVSHAVIISGHGGNNFLKDEEQRMSKEVGVPVLYVEPYEGCRVDDPQYGVIEMEHANSAEHSVAAYMGLLDEKKLAEINRVAAEDPEKALKEWPPLCGLGGFTEFGGPRYEALRNPEWGIRKHAKRFLQEREIIADPEVGRRFFEQNLDNTIGKIAEFIKK